MPTLIKQLTPAGLEPVAYTADSLPDAAQYEPTDGIYTVTNTFNTYETLKLDAHFDRMEDSARRAQIDIQLNRQRVRQALRTMIDESGFGDVRFRITVGREHPDTFILTIEPFAPPSADIRNNGVRCITAPNSARQQAETKSTAWMHQRQALSAAMPPYIYDTFLLDSSGNILEGLGANFYAILENELRTADAGVLKGISQQIVFEIAPPIIPVRRDPVHVSAIGQFSEAFLTSSSRGIIPVVEIDGMKIGSGIVGEYTKALQQAYHTWMKVHLVAL